MELAEPVSKVKSEPEAFSPASAPYIYLDGQRVHSIHPEGQEVIKSLEPWAHKKLLPLLKPVEKCWQPQDLLPEPSSPDFIDQVRRTCTEWPDLACKALHGPGMHWRRWPRACCRRRERLMVV